MKVFEILRTDITAPSEAELALVLSKLDWKYEFADSEYVKSHGHKLMEKAENMVYQSYKINPENTLKIWAKFCPWSKKLDESSIPDFILRFQAIEENVK